MLTTNSYGGPWPARIPSPVRDTRNTTLAVVPDIHVSRITNICNVAQVLYSVVVPNPINVINLMLWEVAMMHHKDDAVLPVVDAVNNNMSIPRCVLKPSATANLPARTALFPEKLAVTIFKKLMRLFVC